MTSTNNLAIYGGKPVRENPWPSYDKGNNIITETDCDAVRDVLQSKLLFRYDYRPIIETPSGKLEKKVENYFGVNHALAVSSGSAAITLALLSLGIKHNDQVGMSAFTFAATPSAIILAGGVPKLIEVDQDLHIDMNDLKYKYTKEMKALVVVHMLGSGDNMEEIMSFAESRDIKVIEDAVPIMGAKFKGKYYGSWGDFGAFSTQSDKSLNTGEGGLLLCKNDFMFAKAITYSGAYEGRWKKHFSKNIPQFNDLDLPLYNFRMDNLRAALALSQMNRLNERITQLASNYDYLKSKISEIKNIHLRKDMEEDSNTKDSLLFSLQNESVYTIVSFARALNAEGIDCKAFGDPKIKNIRCFWNWNFLFPENSIEERMQLFPKTAHNIQQYVDIPLSQTLSHSDLDDLLVAINKVNLNLEKLRGKK